MVEWSRSCCTNPSPNLGEGNGRGEVVNPGLTIIPICPIVRFMTKTETAIRLVDNDPNLLGHDFSCHGNPKV